MIARIRLGFGFCTALLAVTLAGCGGKADAPAPVASSGDDDPTTVIPAEAESQPVAAAADDSDTVKRIVDGPDYDLSVGRELSNLKAGDARLTVSAPKDWEVPTRRPEFVVWFVQKIGQEFPRILVTAEPAPDDLPDTTAENVLELKTWVGKAVDGDAKTLEPARALTIEGVPCVRYVTSAKSRTASLEEQILKTVQGGQLFTVTLQAEVDPSTPQPELVKYRDAGYAVMSSFDVEGPAAAAPETPPAAATPEEDAPVDAADPAEPEN